MSERRPAYPAHAPEMHEDEDEDDKLLVRPALRKEHAKEKSDLDTDDEDLLPLVLQDDLQVHQWGKRTSSIAGPNN